MKKSNHNHRKGLNLNISAGILPVFSLFVFFIFVTLACNQKIIDADKGEFADRVAMMEAVNFEEPVFIGVETMPEFEGGTKGLHSYLSENIQYPEEAIRSNVTGRVTIQFVIEKDGSVGPIKVLRGIGSGCDEEAVRLVENMPAWKPGVQNGEEVRTWFTIPVVFDLSD